MSDSRTSTSLYFAFGSNLSRSRLQDRVGAVGVRGVAVLLGYAHRFDKRGFDGTAKGNIVVDPPCRVHGVLYRLTPVQFDRLARFEGGYRRIEVDVVVRDDGARVGAATFEALDPGCGVDPSAEYLAHYVRGLSEHGIDVGYARELARNLPPSLAALFDPVWRRPSR